MRKHGHEDVVFQDNRMNNKVKKEFEWFCSKDEESDVEDDEKDLMNSTGRTSKRQAEDCSDSEKQQV